VDGFTNPDGVQASGFKLGGIKYLTIKANDRSIYGKMGGTGACAVLTSQAVVVGLYDENIQPGQCVVVVEKLGESLMEQGY